MARARLRPSAFALLLVLAIAADPLIAQRTRPDDCQWRCERGLDTAECVVTGFMGARNCSIVSNCTIFVIPTNPPEIGVSCSYDCKLEYCVWV